MNEIHPNLKRLSHSAETLLHACPRLYELDRLSPKREEDDGDVHTDFGKIVGIGIQDFLVHKDKDRAAFKMFLEWKKDLDRDEQGVYGNEVKKSFYHALYALDKFLTFKDTALTNYEVVHFNGQPATELGFIIDCGDGFIYRGKLDALLVNRISGSYAVFDCKTTGAKRTHDAMFKNSGQGLGYSLVVDAIANSLENLQDKSYEIIYALYKTNSYEWESFRFSKSHTQRAVWIKQILMDMRHIAEYAEEGFFPMYGENCFKFFKPCKFFDICEMSNEVLVGKEPEIKEDKEEDYKFRFDLNEVIEAQLAKQGRV